MFKPLLNKEIAYKALQDFFMQKPFVLFATGTSCAVDSDFGMGSLEEYLKKEIPVVIDNKQKCEWKNVLKALVSNPDFENAMNAIQDKKLLGHVINTTATHISNVDSNNAFDVLNGKKNWPAIGLFKRLVDGLPETDRTLHVATPNYDLMAEYAFTREGIPYTTGFWGGVIRKLDWLQAERQMTYADKIPKGKTKMVTVTRQKKHLRLYKVHGSLNTFLFNNQVVETEIWANVPDGVERLMITPGTIKNEKLHEFRDALLGEYDKAVRSHSAFLFLGFGFNDKQLVNNSIREKLTKQSSLALIITRDSNREIEELLKESINTWLVCKDSNNNFTRILNVNYPGGLHLPDKEIWKFDRFTTEILGG